MRIRSLTLTAASGAALLAAGLLPAVAFGVPDPPFAREEPVGAADLQAKVASCEQVSNGLYRTDSTSAASVPVCGARGAVFWKADMDIDCDGRRTARCNEATDPWFQPDTAFHQSDGEPLRSDSLPFVVLPSVSGVWDHSATGIQGGSVVAVIHEDRLLYAVVGDTGPQRIIGEASYAAAEALGIDPDPATGGTASEVTYILFKGSLVSPIESHAAAVSLGERLARDFVENG